MSFDALYCDEEHLDDEDPSIENPRHQIKNPTFNLLFEHALSWDEDELVTLLSKEQKEALFCSNAIISDESLRLAREDAVKWMLKASSRHGFNAVTAVHAVSYYDRFVTSLCFQRDKPLMSKLAAVACVSIAAKVEEIQVPLLLDLQVEESQQYLFEAKTVQRMELLVLSALQWKVNFATPISFIEQAARRFRVINNMGRDFLSRCGDWILSAITDCRLLNHLPSVIAAATMMHVLDEMEACDSMKHSNQITSSLGATKENVDECYKLMEERRGCCNLISLNEPSMKKRRHELLTVKMSPIGVNDGYYLSSDDSSVDSWDALLCSSSTEQLLKRSKVFP